MSATPNPELSDIVDIMREMAVDRRRQDAERTEERRRYEEDNERRLAAVTKQMELLERMVSAKEAKRDTEPLKLTKLSETDDIESYLTTFERLMTAYEVEANRWAYKLAPQLTGKAQQAYASLDTDDAKSYSAVKAAILRRYNINDETYHLRFRGLKYKTGQTPTEITTRLTDLAGKWLKDCTTADEVKDAVVKEQLLATLPEDVRVWVTERKPKTIAEAGQLAEDYLQARTTGTLSVQKSDRPPTGPCPRCGEHGHWARHCPNPPRSNDSTGQHPSSRGPTQNLPQSSRNGKGYRPSPSSRSTDGKPFSMENVKCYNCNEKGHFSSNCPRKALFCTPPETDGRQQTWVHYRGTVNGIYCTDIIADTGANKTLVRGDLVRAKDMVDGQITIRCAHGDSVSYPLAHTKIRIGEADITVQAAVVDSLPAAVLLGWDIPELPQLVHPTSIYPGTSRCTCGRYPPSSTADASTLYRTPSRCS